MKKYITRKEIIKTIEKNHYWLYAAILLILLPLLANCDREPINSDVEGHWKLEEFTIQETGEKVACERIFWGITRAGAKLFEKQGKHGYAPLDALIEYRNNETVFVLKDILVMSSKEENKKTPTLEQMLPYGLNNAEESVFEVVRASHKQLVLQSDFARLQFLKF